MWTQRKQKYFPKNNDLRPGSTETVGEICAICGFSPAAGCAVCFVAGPHVSQAFYCGGGSGHVYCVALGRIPRRTVEYACGILPSRALYPCPSAPPRHETL